jgi:TPR repeat protein
VEQILIKLAIDPAGDIYSIKEQLEKKQLEYINKLDLLQFKSGGTEKNEQLEKQIETDLQEIEEALKLVSKKIWMISTGISITKVADYGKQKKTEAIVKAGPSDPQPDLLCDEADKFLLGSGVEKNYNKAFELYRKAEELGSARAQIELGWMYYDGNGVPKDNTKALELIEKAALRENAKGQNALGLLYLKGEIVSKDEMKAFEWMSKAADQGYAMAQCNLSTLYKEGKVVPKDYSKAFEWCQRAVEQGFPKGKFLMGKYYVEGIGVPIDIVKAVFWYRKAAEDGYEPVFRELAKRYETGNGVKKDPAEAIKWYQLAYEQGYRKAEVKIDELKTLLKAISICEEADRYLFGWNKDYDKAIELYNKAEALFIEKSLVPGCIYSGVGCMYYEGWGVKRDYEKALKLSQQAKDLDDARGHFNIALMQMTGKGLEQNTEEAIKGIVLAAGQGYARAQTYLGELYEVGKYLEKNDNQAIEWYRKAADQGDVTAQVRLGTMHREGRGVGKEEAAEWLMKAAEQENRIARVLLMNMFQEDAKAGEAKAQFIVGFMNDKAQDIDAAITWYTKAAEQGHAGAQDRLGYKYLYGVGVSSNVTSAIEWYSKAAAQNNIESILQLGDIYLNGNILKRDIGKAAEYYRKAAELGDERAKTKLELIDQLKQLDAICDEGDQFLQAKDYQNAFEAYTKAKEMGSPRGISGLGGMYLRKLVKGEILLGQEKKGLMLLEQAAALGDASAQCMLAEYKYDNYGDREIDLVIDLLTKAANQGNVRAKYKLGVTYWNIRQSNPKYDMEKAIEWYTQAADEGDLDAQLTLAEIYEKGPVFICDDNKAIEYLNKASEQGSLQAKYDLAEKLMKWGSGEYIPKEDQIKAFQLYSYLMGENYGRVKMKLGDMYRDGIGVAKDSTKAAELYADASCGGFFSEPRERLRDIYNKELAVSKSFSEAYLFFKKYKCDYMCELLLGQTSRTRSIENFVFMQRFAEETNDSKVYKHLGEMHFYGRGTVKSYKDAFQCYKKAASLTEDDLKGYLEKVDKAINQEMIFNQAMRMLETSSFQQAVDTLIKLADDEYADAQIEVGKMYMNGYRLKKNDNLAYKYFKQAKNNEHTEAEQYLKQVQ